MRFLIDGNRTPPQRMHLQSWRGLWWRFCHPRCGTLAYRFDNLTSNVCVFISNLKDFTAEYVYNFNVKNICPINDQFLSNMEDVFTFFCSNTNNLFLYLPLAYCVHCRSDICCCSFKHHNSTNFGCTTARGQILDETLRFYHIYIRYGSGLDNGWKTESLSSRISFLAVTQLKLVGLSSYSSIIRYCMPRQTKYKPALHTRATQWNCNAKSVNNLMRIFRISREYRRIIESLFLMFSYIPPFVLCLAICLSLFSLYARARVCITNTNSQFGIMLFLNLADSRKCSVGNSTCSDLVQCFAGRFRRSLGVLSHLYHGRPLGLWLSLPLTLFCETSE